MADADLVVAVRRMLANSPAVTSMVGTSTKYSTWIFQWRNYVEVEGTGSASIVISQRPGQAPNQHNTQQFPIIQLEIYVDAARTTTYNPADSVSQHHRAYRIVKEADKFLHLVGRAGAPWLWGDSETEDPIRVFGCYRVSEPDIMEVPGGDGLIRATVRYEVSTAA